MLQIFHEDPKESYQLVENAHLMSPLIRINDVYMLI